MLHIGVPDDDSCTNTDNSHQAPKSGSFTLAHRQLLEEILSGAVLEIITLYYIYLFMSIFTMALSIALTYS